MRLATRLILIAGTALAAAPALADSAATRRAVAAQNEAVKDAIDSLAKGPLRDLGDSLAKIDTQLANLQLRTDAGFRELGPASLGDLSKGEGRIDGKLGYLIDRDDALARRFDALQSGMQANAAQWGRGEAELAQAIGGQAARLDTLGDALQANGRSLAGDLAADFQALGRGQDATAVRAEKAALRAGWGGWLAAAVAIGALAAVLVERRSRQRRQNEIQSSIDRLALELRRAFASVAPAPAAPAAEIELRLRGAVERLEGLLPAPAEPPPLAAATPAPASTHPSEKPTVSVSRLPEPSVPSRLLWPAEFLDADSALSRWRFLLESHFGDPDHPALPVLAALLNLRALLDRETSGPEIATAAYRVSESLHAYLQSLTELSAEDRQQASAAWLGCLRRLIASSAPRLDLREILPGMRVDPDLMHAVKEGPGNHLNVAEVFSWAVLDRSNDRPKVLYRAQIAST